LTFACLVASSGCEERPSVPRLRYTVLLVGTHAGDPTWQALQAGASRFARDAPSLDIRKELPGSPTPVAQKALLDTVGRESGVHAVSILACDAKVLVQPVTRLIADGIPVILVGDDARQTRRSAFVGVDEMAVGRLLIQTFASMSKEHRTLMVVHDNRGSERSAKRFDGVRRELAIHPDITMLREFDCLGQATRALQTLRETSERYPNLGGWILLDDWLDAEPSGAPLVHGSPKIISYGAHPGNFRHLESGRVHALVGGDWEAVGYRVMQSCLALLNRSAFPVTDERLPPVVVTRTDLDAYRKKWAHWVFSTTSRATSVPAR